MANDPQHDSPVRLTAVLVPHSCNASTEATREAALKLPPGIIA